MTKKQVNEEAKEKLRAFLKGGGDPDDVASVLVHTLMHRADVAAELQKGLVEDENKAKSEKTD